MYIYIYIYKYVYLHFTCTITHLGFFRIANMSAGCRRVQIVHYNIAPLFIILVDMCFPVSSLHSTSLCEHVNISKLNI